MQHVFSSAPDDDPEEAPPCRPDPSPNVSTAHAVATWSNSSIAFPRPTARIVHEIAGLFAFATTRTVTGAHVIRGWQYLADVGLLRRPGVTRKLSTILPYKNVTHIQVAQARVRSIRFGDEDPLFGRVARFNTASWFRRGALTRQGDAAD